MTERRIRQPVERMSLGRIAALLERDGYASLIGREADIKRAARQGSLLWTRSRLTVSMPSQGIELDVRPEID